MTQMAPRPPEALSDFIARGEGACEPLEVSFVMPCLNEARTLASCVGEAMQCIKDHNLRGEVIVADNGSTDGSQDIARKAGARVVPVTAKGYGNALQGGIAAAEGRFIVMGDADESYNFTEAWPMIERLRAGADMVMGNRFTGRIMPGAMPKKHQYFGNPVLTWIGNIIFGVPVGDFNCGLRAFRKDAYQKWDVRTTGMEFASELVIKAHARGSKMDEVPITLRKDGRGRPPHLRSWRDGWRNLRFMLTLSPRWTLFIPGATLCIIGLVLGALVAGGPLTVGNVHLDVHTLVAAAIMVIVGYQAMMTGVAMRVFAVTSAMGPPSDFLTRQFKRFTLERGVVLGLVTTVLGVACIAVPTVIWVRHGFGDLDTPRTLRPMIVGAALVALGVETVLMSFVISMLGIERR